MTSIEHLIDRLKGIYRAIDSTYQSAIDYYRFSCQGCHANCCYTRFFHYTHIEALYLHRGFKGLSPKERAEILQLALDYEETYSKGTDDQAVLCPLNTSGLCVLYEWRPMICRLHGVPYELQDVNGVAQFYGGCEKFMSLNPETLPTYRTLNRTIFYREMANLEGELRKTLGLQAPMPQTVAKILLTEDYQRL